ncbi:Ldh family oxidoreductase [Ignatzschineria rhizosphaerae]|uniref:Ldh family oxidoreductase n=1 Tax=Ignatzschineria rhizosphaerae TaxID=2923279 RepID=A0ABY3X0C0_9GAMM|nr:Ldh family oxidoreductase [Ignatzschineria rhizosphaerae]UNM96327.1 Ldh family oxidoreductase [Ignatzschineria rhizosphaerae]
MKISIDQLQNLIEKILDHYGFSKPHRDAVVKNLMTAQIADCQSHGIWRILELIKNLDKGMLNPKATPKVTESRGAIIRLDCQMTSAQYGHDIGMPLLINKAKELGIALLAINHSIHFSALWVELETLVKQGLVGLCMTTSHSWVAPCGGKAPLLGTNPFAFAWPRVDPSRPYIFDFATSATARGEIQLHAREHKILPEGLAIDAKGNPTTDPEKALQGAMLTFGGYKGTAISTMIELLAGPLINDLTSQESQIAAKDGASLPYGGELIIAIDPKMILGDSFDEAQIRAENYLHQFSKMGVRLPSERRFNARDENLKNGELTISESLIADLNALIDL